MTETTREHKWTTAKGAPVTLRVTEAEVPAERRGDDYYPAHTRRECRLVLTTGPIAGEREVGEPEFNRQTNCEAFEVFHGGRLVAIIPVPAAVIEAVWGEERRARDERNAKQDGWDRADREMARRHGW
jgi:hypothetical protein